MRIRQRRRGNALIEVATPLAAFAADEMELLFRSISNKIVGGASIAPAAHKVPFSISLANNLVLRTITTLTGLGVNNIVRLKIPNISFLLVGPFTDVLEAKFISNGKPCPGQQRV